MPETCIFHPKVTVIIPVYNVENYIEECIESVFAQSIDNLEIIVIDDGSTDRTANIVKTLLPPPGKSLQLISQPNSGLSSARNLGISIARGEWIGMVDGDDWIQPDMYEAMFRHAETMKADLAICKGCLVDHETRKIKLIQDIELWERLISEEAQLYNPLLTPDLFLLSTSACWRLYRQSFLKEKDFKFANGLIFEDILAHYQLLCSTSRVALINKLFYYYRTGHTGRITERKDHKILDVIKILQQCIIALKKNQASAQLWGNFIWFQNWVLLWLCCQINDGDSRKFTNGAFKIARQFPHDGLQFFKCNFLHDEHAQKGVFLQLIGSSSIYRDFAKTGKMQKLHNHLFKIKPVHQILQFRTRLLNNNFTK